VKNEKISILLILLIIFTIKFIYAQRIHPGEYNPIYDYDPVKRQYIILSEYGETIRFLNDSQFTYNYHDDITNDLGFGKYSLIHDTLKLNFLEKPADYDTSSFKVIKEKLSNTDFIKYKIEIKHVPDSSLLEGARIEYISKYSYKDSLINKHVAVSSDKDGVANLVIKKESLPGILRITYVGFKTLTYSVADSLNRNIEVYMRLPYRIIRPGKVITYWIKDIDSDSFYLYGGIWTEWTQFMNFKK
jgi:hypothetical protein